MHIYRDTCMTTCIKQSMISCVEVYVKRNVGRGRHLPTFVEIEKTREHLAHKEQIMEIS